MMMLSGTTLVIVGLLLTVPAVAPMPLPCTFVETKDLTSSEIAHVRRLARPTGKSPWLVFGCRMTVGPKRAHLGVFLDPDAQNGRLRRGRVLSIVSGTSAAGGQKASWRVESTSHYVHVVVPGRRPDEVTGKQDYARPFPVEGEFDDAMLLSLVDFIRSSPQDVDGSMPISYVRKTAAGVEVKLDSSNWSGQVAILQQRNGRWVIVSLSVWAA